MKKVCFMMIALAFSPASFAQDATVPLEETSTNIEVAKIEPAVSTGVVTQARSRVSQGTNTVASTNRSSVTTRPVDNVRVVTSKNIFDQTRYPGTSGRTRISNTRTSPSRVESFGLVGTILSKKGETAIFAGTSSSYQKTLKKGDSIAGYKVDNITTKSVSLLGTNAPIEMKIGNYLRRENEGAWILSAMPEPAPLATTSETSSTTTTSAPTSSAGSAEVSDVMKAMIERRERELSK